MNNRKILVIDDDPALIRLLEELFRAEGAEVAVAQSAQEGLHQFRVHRPDLVILDIMMPDINGIDVCRSLRRLSDVPMLFLTALNRPQDIVRGLDAGADDFLAKPFSGQVLLARARALLRRPAMAPESDRPLVYDDGYLLLDLDRRRVSVCHQTVRLSPTEYRVLAYLVQNVGRVLTHEQILESVWGNAYVDSPHYVHMYVHRLRQRLEEDPRHPRYLLTEPGVGYRFEWPCLSSQ